MIEDFQGKIINDDDVSLPKMEDYYYNSLAPMIDIDQLTVDSQFFIEDPPDGDDAVGLSADSTMFIIKTGPGYNVKNKEAAFVIPNVSIYTGMNNAYALQLDISKCNVGNNAQNKEFLAQLGGLTAYKNYLKKKIDMASMSDEELENDTTQYSDIKLRLLFTDGPQTPKYTVEKLKKKLVKKMKFSEMAAAGVHAQPFQAEFDRDNGTLALSKEPSIRKYISDDEVYVYNDVVQVWPREKYTENKDSISKDSISNPTPSKTEAGGEDISYYYEKLSTNSLVDNVYSKDFFRSFSDLDKLGRCRVMAACISGNHDFPKDDRDTIATVIPAGWHSYKFESIINKEKNKAGDIKNPNGNLYNRCHLLGNGLSGEGENVKNLVTATSTCNQYMLDCVEHDLKMAMQENPDKKFYYKVAPNYEGNELLPRSITMEVLSAEDNGASYNVAYKINNVEKGICINYLTGEAWEKGKETTADEDYASFYVLNTNRAQLETINLALRLRNKVLQMVKDASDSRVVVSTNGLSRRSDYKPPYGTDFTEPDTKIWEAFKDAYSIFKDRFFSDDIWHKYSGFNLYGLDAYGKTLGVVYLKSKEYNDKWINLNKYIIYLIYSSQAVKQSNYIPDTSSFESYYSDPAGERFKAWTYDIENINYQDNFWKQLETRYGQDERRRKIQQNIFNKAGIHPNINSDYKKDDGTQYNCLKDWTISIGDVTFFCPPSAIRVITQTNTERLPVLRAKGSMAKNIEKSDTDIELSLYFNNEYGINGFEYKDYLWENKDKDISPLKKAHSDEEITYYMNGLRALISEFKFTPFLPVINTYLNRTLKIAAVSLEQLDIETVPNFPRLLKASLRLKKFDYHIYMPEVPEMFVPDENENSNEVENPFTQCINYDVMRYYYQKPLIYGNELDEKLQNPEKSGYSFNSVQFVKDTLLKNRTALMPCHFMDPNIDIYMANEDYLKKLFDLKKDAINKMKMGYTDNFVPDTIQSKFIANIGSIWGELYPIFAKYQKYKETLIEECKNQYHYGKDNKTGPTEYTYSFTTIDGKSKKEFKFFSSSEKSVISNFFNKVLYELVTEPCHNEIIEKITTDKKGLLSKYINGTKKVFSNDKNKATWFEIVINDSSVLNGFNDVSILWDQYCKINTKTKDEKNSITDLSIAKEQLSAGTILIAFNDIQSTNWLALENRYYINLYGYDTLIDFYTWCASESQNLLDANQEASNLKEAIDWENAKSIQYDLVAENVRVDLFQSSMANNFAKISLLDSEGGAAQYMGSSDVHIVWKIVTKDEELAMIMKQLPDYEAYCMRKYHLVLPCFPIKIDSEFTRMLGVYEVSIEHVIVNTVPNHPGLYDIEVRAISVDRTLRNREALKSVDNKVDSNKDGQSGELNNKALLNASTKTEVTIRTFSELDQKMAQAEVYPDLELPTIGELGKKGFIFMRYKEKARDQDDLFVDPDFYFYYPFSTFAEMVRNTIQACFNQSDLKNTNLVQNSTTIYSDNSGNSGVNFTAKDGKVNFDNANDEMKQTINDIIKERDEQIAGKRDIDDLRLAEHYTAALMGDPGKWDIASSITIGLTENFYIELQNQFKKADEKVAEADAKAKTEEVSEDKKDEPKLTPEQQKAKELKEEQEKKRLEQLKQLKDFCDNQLTNKDNAVQALYKRLKETPVSTRLSADDEIASSNGITEYKALLDDLYIKQVNDGDQQKGYTNFIKAVQAAYTGDYEYNSEISEEKWCGKNKFYGIYKTDNGTLQKADEKTELDKIFYFGSFNIRAYTYSEIMTYLNAEERKELQEFYNKQKESDKTNDSLRFTLDPYYRYQSKEVQNEYFKKCQESQEFASLAFIRIMLWWLVQLYKENFFPSISLDITGKTVATNNEASKKAKDLVEKEYGINTVTIADNLENKAADFVKRNEPNLARGKIFTAILFALYDMPMKSNPFYSMMKSRDYDGLNNKIKELTSENYKRRNNVDTKDALLRKFILALCGYKEIAGQAYIGRSSEITPAASYVTTHNVKLALEAALDPSKYMFHSFYDMIRNDYRGRMLRAFPTFYCLFMDEGKEIGLWKLHDNFYSINSIADISIVKSRKIAADTCTIVLSNNYQTFTTDDEDGYINYKNAGFGEIWDSIFHEKKEVDKAEQRRLAAMKVNKGKLQPGIRIHVREGYGSDARELAGIFNGVISSVEPNNQAINVVAQGNGIELMNPIMEDRDADEIQYMDTPGDAINNTEGGGATPHTILKSFLTIKGGSVKKYLQGKYSKSQMAWKNGVADLEEESWINLWARYTADVWNKNMYGITHFGDPDYTDTFPDGEIVQNIYEVSAFPNMAREDLKLYKEGENDRQPPYISFEPRGKTFWDIMHICQSVAPDYIVGTASFGLRDTIFYGKPHYYYAYKYKRHNNIWVEQRKPFQQFHVVYSDQDIISNNITASSDKVKTVATGLYKDKAGWVDRNKDVGPLWVDKNIYPEGQKSMVVNTGLKMKDSSKFLLRADMAGSDSMFNTGVIGLDLAGNLFRNTVQSCLNVVGGAFATIGSIMAEDYNWFSYGEDHGGRYGNHKKIAWSATANALKEAVKEMYQGDITIIGSPSIKPNDRLIIKDTYNDMSGSVLIRDVVHNLNQQTGFTTTVHVDAISTVDDQSEKIKHSSTACFMKQLGMLVASGAFVKYSEYKGGKILGDFGASVAKKAGSVINSTIKTEAVKNSWKTATEYLTKITDSKYLAKITKFIGKNSGKIAKTVGAIGAATVMIGGAPVTLAALAAAVAAFVIKTLVVDGIVTAITSSIQNFFLDMIKNSKVLQVYPLKKNGLVYTAGLDGNLGLVYGSPTYNQVGPIEKALNYTFAGDDKDKNLFAKALCTFIGTPEIQAEAAKYSRDFAYASRVGVDANSSEIAIESVSLGVAKKASFNVRKKTSFDMSLGNRVVIKHKNNEEYRKLTNGLKQYYIDNIDSLIANSKQKNQILINQYNPLKPYIDYKFLDTVHNNLDNAKEVNFRQYDVVISNQKVKVNGIQATANVIDIPFLTSDALRVLKDICDNSFKNLDINNNKDNAEIEKQLNGTKIIVESALRVGDENMLCSSGYSFSIKGTGKLANGVLLKNIENYRKTIQDKLDSIGNKRDKEVCWIISKSNSEEVRINVMPESQFGRTSPDTESKKEEDDKK